MTNERDVIVFEVTTTLEDQLALQHYLTASLRKGKTSLLGGLEQVPRRARSGARYWPVFVVFFGLMFIGVATNDQGVDVLNTLFGVSFGWKLAVQLLLLVLMLFVIPSFSRRWWERWRRKVAAVELYRNRADVAPGDPTMAIRRQIRFDDDGFTTQTALVDHWESWRRINGLDETADLLVLRIGRSVGYGFPKRDLSPALQERLHLFVVQRCASKWPF